MYTGRVYVRERSKIDGKKCFMLIGVVGESMDEAHPLNTEMMYDIRVKDGVIELRPSTLYDPDLAEYLKEIPPAAEELPNLFHETIWKV